MYWLKTSALALSVAALVACSDSSDKAPEQPTPQPVLKYQAKVTRTPYGIPHIKADDWGSLGYGYAYTIAEDNYCVIMREFVVSKGESARYFGSEGDLNRDKVMKLYNDDARIKRVFIDTLPENLLAAVEGYVAGLNQYLADTGVDNLAEGDEGCRGADWVRKADVYDMGRLFHGLVLRGSAAPLADYIAAAGGPGVAPNPVKISRAPLQNQIDREQFIASITPDVAEQLGSNAYAVGTEASQTGKGILLGNPHFPWQGSRRFYVSHLTMGDEYDVYGGSLYGMPINAIGFNDNVAWSHTVSTGKRFTLYELTLNPSNPLQYEYDGEMRDFSKQTVSVDKLRDDGTVETIEHTFYFSHYGPVVDLGALSPLLANWPNSVGTVLVYRDANLENLRGVEQWLKMGQSKNMAEFTEALKAIGIPWVNTIAADRYGQAFYGDISVNPHVTEAQLDNCVRGTVQTLLTDYGLITMDGADPACEWGSDADTAAGIFGYDNLPKLQNTEYVANANDSYWLANPRQLLTGYSPIIGGEETERGLRTRQTFVQAEQRMAGTDGLGETGFNVDNIRTLLYQATNIAADLVLDDVLALCQGVADWSTYEGSAESNAKACDVLANWDRSYRVSSVGGPIFWEFWKRFRETDNIWAVAFDPTDPVYTPRDLNRDDATVAAAVLDSFVAGVAALDAAGVALDAPLGEVQFVEKNGVRYGIPGGSSKFMFSITTSELVDGKGYADIRHGNSYIQAVTWDDGACPIAYSMITYSQSTDPASPHYADATELYSNEGWIDAVYCEQAVMDAAVSTKTLELYE
ncbi:MAG: hypothetical protein CSA53_03125 [Gammaproteobacteria bacterium]|nr:MAG: hypothetical protein CSA53_03125 [Gammaproteobacteria bacterium]